MKYLYLLLLWMIVAPVAVQAGGAEVRVNAAKKYGKSLCVALWMFTLDRGRYPTHEEGLLKLTEPRIDNYGAAGKPYFTHIESDPWGNSYQYRVEKNDVKVWSMGPDGLSDSADDIGPNLCEEEEKQAHP